MYFKQALCNAEDMESLLTLDKQMFNAPLYMNATCKILEVFPYFFDVGEMLTSYWVAEVTLWINLKMI